MTVRIVTDSSCDLRGDEVANLNIEVVPLSIRFGDDEYTDREQLSVDRFYELLASSDTLPETAAPSPGRFAESFQRHLDAGATAISYRRARSVEAIVTASLAEQHAAAARPRQGPPSREAEDCCERARTDAAWHLDQHQPQWAYCWRTGAEAAAACHVLEAAATKG